MTPIAPCAWCAARVPRAMASSVTTRAAAMAEVARPAGQRPHGDVGRHLRPHRRLGGGDEVQLHGLKRRHRLAELAAGVGVVDRHLRHRRQCASGHHHAREGAARPQLIGQVSDVDQHVLDVVEGERCGDVIAALAGEVGTRLDRHLRRLETEDHRTVAGGGTADDPLGTSSPGDRAFDREAARCRAAPVRGRPGARPGWRDRRWRAAIRRAAPSRRAAPARRGGRPPQDRRQHRSACPRSRRPLRRSPTHGKPASASAAQVAADQPSTSCARPPRTCTCRRATGRRCRRSTWSGATVDAHACRSVAVPWPRPNAGSRWSRRGS